MKKIIILMLLFVSYGMSQDQKQVTVTIEGTPTTYIVSTDAAGNVDVHEMTLHEANENGKPIRDARKWQDGVMNPWCKAHGITKKSVRLDAGRGAFSNGVIQFYREACWAAFSESPEGRQIIVSHVQAVRSVR